MKMTKLLGVTLVTALLAVQNGFASVVQESVKGGSVKECHSDFKSAVTRIKDDTELCGLIKTFFNCVDESGQSLSSERQEKLETKLSAMFNTYNLTCDFSIDEIVDQAFNGDKISSTSLSFLTLILVAFGGFTLTRTLA